MIKINGVNKKLTVEEEHGKWFWVLADMGPGNNEVDYSVKFKDKEKGKISSWIVSDAELSNIKIDNESLNNDELLPAKPYPADIQKEIVPIKSFKIQ